MVIEWAKYGKPSSVGIVTGMVAGLASITPASGFVGPIGAIIIGIAGGAICQWVTTLFKQTLKIDDSLDVFAVHGVGGMFGIIMLVVFGHAGATEQFGGLAVVGIWTLVTTTVIVLVVKAIFPLRVGEEDEATGLDLSSHGERAYDMSS
jgi:Amt family ammonium transporter